MTVSSTTIKTAPYACDGATVTFAFSWAIWASSEIKVILRTAATGVEETLTETTHYSVTLSTDTPSAGSITTVSAYSSDYEIVIKANFPNTQEVDYGEGDTFPASSHEEALDRGVRLVQQLNEKLGRAILFPETTTLEDVELPEISSTVADYYLKANNAGSALEWGDLVAYGDLAAHDAGARESIHANLIADLMADTNASSAGLALVATAAEVAALNEATKTISPESLAGVWEYQTLQVPGGSFRPAQTTAGTQDVQEYPGSETMRDYIELEDFNGESVAYDVTLWLPEQWDQAILKSKVAWMASYDEAMAAGSAISIGFQTKAYNAGSAIDTNWSTPPIYISDTVSNVATDTEEETIASDNIASNVAGSTNRLDIRVTRDNTIANNATAPLWITQVLFQYRQANQASGW